MEENRLPPVHVRLSPALMDALDRCANTEHAGNRSAAIKAMLMEGLDRRGMWPPK